jgi:drug/metabolite transporter (DMT)-like permease
MVFLVLARVCLSVSANAVQKRLVFHGALVSRLWLLTYLLMLGPACFLAAVNPVLESESFWGDILLGGFIDALGNLAMVAALRLTDLSVFGPLNAFRPVLALIFGWLFLHENPSSLGAAGVGVTVVGAIFLLKNGNTGEVGRALALRKDLSTPGTERVGVANVLGLRLLGLSLSTFGAVFLKRAAGVASAEVTLAGWIICGVVCLAVAYVIKLPPKGPSPAEVSMDRRGWYLGHAVLFLGMQWITIRIFQETLLAYSFVFFQLGMILQVMVGRVIFREPAFKRRLAGCIVMALGSALILWKG